VTLTKSSPRASVWQEEADYGISPIFLSLVRSEPLQEMSLLDIGCGWGRLALLLAPEARRVVGLDRDATAIAEARRLAAERSLANTEFVVADAEQVEYGEWHPEMVVAHLCMSDAIIERASRALTRGRFLSFVCFHTDQWKETGKVSRFAYGGERLRSVLEANGFVPETLEVDTEVVEFSTVAEGLRLVEGIRLKWEADGRWANFVAYLRSGGRSLTRSHLIVKARRQ
jgi:SAM-dependent methyltransferase